LFWLRLWGKSWSFASESHVFKATLCSLFNFMSLNLLRLSFMSNVRPLWLPCWRFKTSNNYKNHFVLFIFCRHGQVESHYDKMAHPKKPQPNTSRTCHNKYLAWNVFEVYHLVLQTRVRVAAPAHQAPAGDRVLVVRHETVRGEPDEGQGRRNQDSSQEMHSSAIVNHHHL